MDRSKTDRRMPGQGQGVLARFARDCEGTTAIEYTVIAAGISVAIVATVSNIGSEVSGLYAQVLDSFGLL